MTNEQYKTILSWIPADELAILKTLGLSQNLQILAMCASDTAFIDKLEAAHPGLYQTLVQEEHDQLNVLVEAGMHDLTNKLSSLLMQPSIVPVDFRMSAIGQLCATGISGRFSKDIEGSLEGAGEALADFINALTAHCPHDEAVLLLVALHSELLGRAAALGLSPAMVSHESEKYHLATCEDCQKLAEAERLRQHPPS